MPVSSVTLLFVVIQVCARFTVGQGAFKLTVLANGQNRNWNFDPGTEVELACEFSCSDASLAGGSPTLKEVLDRNNLKPLKTTGGDCVDSLGSSLYYTIRSSSAHGEHTYRCQFPSLTDFTEETVTFTTSTEPTTHSGTTEPTTHSGTTEGGTSSDDKFTGLNPLIYTISAVILLGTLAIVAIITCWIRARRSFHNRQFRPDSTPQDYLDYISDNEFTPLTSSEFLASLEQRPPTYNQSEELESQMRRSSTQQQAESEGSEGQGGNEQGSERRSDSVPGRSQASQLRAVRGRSRGGRARSNSDGGGMAPRPRESQRRNSSASETSPAPTAEHPAESGASGHPVEGDSGTSEQSVNPDSASGCVQPVEGGPLVAALIDFDEDASSANDQDSPLNETRELSSVPIPTLFDLTLPTLDLATPTHDLAPPTQEQMTEIDAAANAVTERISQLSAIGNEWDRGQFGSEQPVNRAHQVYCENVTAHLLDT